MLTVTSPLHADFPDMRSLNLSSLSWSHMSFRSLFTTYPNASQLDVTSKVVKPACDGEALCHHIARCRRLYVHVTVPDDAFEALLYEFPLPEGLSVCLRSFYWTSHSL